MSNVVAFEVGRLYAPIKEISDVLSLGAREIFVRLPGIRAYWPMSGVSLNGDAVDHSGTGYDLNMGNTVTYSYDGNPYVQLGNGNNYLVSTSNVFQITGTETYIDPSFRGLTVGGWFLADSSPTTNVGMVTKSDGSPGRSYALILTNLNQVQGVVSGDGTTFALISSTEITIGQWIFAVMRFTPGTELAVFVNAAKAVLTSSIPSSLYQTTAPLEVGRWVQSAIRVFPGRARDVFICATALPDDLIELAMRTSLP